MSLLRRNIPLWVHEGGAEYERGIWDPLDLMTVRDAAVADIIPQMSQMEGYGDFGSPRLVYNLGHALYEFIEARWGKDGVRQFLFSLRKSAIGGGTSPYEEAFQMTAREFDQQFEKYLKDRFKAFRDKERPADYGQDLSPDPQKSNYTIDDRACVVGFLGVRRQVLTVVGRPLLVAERLETILEIFLELLVELARRHLERFFVRTRAAADRALAQREEELPHAVLAPARFDEFVERVAEVIDQAGAAEIAVAFHLAHLRDDVGDRRVAHRHQIERIPDAALVFGAAFVHPERDVTAEQRHRDEVVLKHVRQLVDDQPVEQIRRQIDRQHHPVALAFGEREHAFRRWARRDVLLFEFAVRLEDDERDALVEIVPQIRADLLIRALGVAGDPLEVPLVFRVVVNLEMVGLINMPLELVVVDLVLAVVRRDLRLRVDGAALRVELRPRAEHPGSQPLRVRLICGCQGQDHGEQADGSIARDAHAHTSTS